jgi:hypothetical protein
MSSNQQSWLNPSRVLAAYAAVFSIFIIWASLRTAINPHPHGIGIQVLALVEVAGALLFVIRKTRAFGLTLLLAVFAIAAVIELHLREWPARFVFYGATALFVQYHSVHRDDGAKQMGTPKLSASSS